MTTSQELTVYDELAELRRWLRSSEIAVIAGLRPETISRLAAGKPSARRTEQRIDDLYTVVERLRPRLSDQRQVRFALNRRREDFGGSSFADLIRSGRAEWVLRALGRELAKPTVSSPSSSTRRQGAGR